MERNQQGNEDEINDQWSENLTPPSENIAISDLIVTQGGLRDLETVQTMAKYVSQGGNFSKDSLELFYQDKKLEKPPNLIIISPFDDASTSKIVYLKPLFRV